MDVKFIVCCVLLSLCSVPLHGQKVYNYTAEICCDGVLQPRVNTGISCCGNATYQAYTYGENVTYSNAQPVETCCSGKAYKYNKSQMCCGDQMQAIVGQPEDNICCGDKIYHKPDSNFLCCDGQALQTAGSQSCCNETILNEPNIDCFYHSCAGRSLLGNETCCKGVIHSLSQEDSIIRGYYCCGSALVRNLSAEICCRENGVVVAGNPNFEGCCNGTVYNRTTHLCCESTLYPHPENQNLKCCDSQSYDPNKEICCAKKVVIPVENAPQMGCCLPNSEY